MTLPSLISPYAQSVSDIHSKSAFSDDEQAIGIALFALGVFADRFICSKGQTHIFIYFPNAWLCHKCNDNFALEC